MRGCRKSKNFKAETHNHVGGKSMSDLNIRLIETSMRTFLSQNPDCKLQKKKNDALLTVGTRKPNKYESGGDAEYRKKAYLPTNGDRWLRMGARISRWSYSKSSGNGGSLQPMTSMCCL